MCQRHKLKYAIEIKRNKQKSAEKKLCVCVFFLFLSLSCRHLISFFLVAVVLIFSFLVFKFSFSLQFVYWMIDLLWNYSYCIAYWPFAAYCIVHRHAMFISRYIYSHSWAWTLIANFFELFTRRSAAFLDQMRYTMCCNIILYLFAVYIRSPSLLRVKFCILCCCGVAVGQDWIKFV